MRTLSRLLVTLIAASLVSGNATAQSNGSTDHSRLPARVGERVRITAPQFAGGVILGKIIGYEIDTIVVESAKDTARLLRVPRDKIIGVEAQRGQKRNWLTGAIVGGVVGGILAAVTTGEDSDSPGLRSLVITGGAGAGALLGLGIGGLTKSDRWQAVRLEAPMHSLSEPVTPRLQIAVRF